MEDPLKTIRLIGQEWKYSDIWSGLILIGRELNLEEEETYYPVLSESSEESGDDGDMDTPVTISNTEVKHINGEDSERSRK